MSVIPAKAVTGLAVNGYTPVTIADKEYAVIKLSDPNTGAYVTHMMCTKEFAERLKQLFPIPSNQDCA